MKRVLVVGDAMLDHYWFGSVDRISPEAPVPVVSIERSEERLGGAANVAANIAAMGVPVETLYSESFASTPVVKVRLIAQRQQVARVDFDHPQAPIDVRMMMAKAREAEIVVFSDYRKGALSEIPGLIWKAKADGKTVLVDPKGRRFLDYAGADVLKPNLAELRALVGGWSSETELEHKVKAMQREAKIPAVLLTRGPDGMTLFSGSVTQIPCYAREVFDVSGAGDTALAAFAAAIARGHDYRKAAEFANRAAGVAVGRFGTAVVEEKEVFG